MARDALRWLSCHRAEGLPPIREAVRLAGEYCALRGANEDSNIWLLDQGRLQLGSWVPRSVEQDALRHADQLRGFVTIGNAVVILAVHPTLATNRMRQRGDLQWGHAVANARGFSSFTELCRFEFENVCSKVELAQALGAAVLRIEISRHAEIRNHVLLPALTTTEGSDLLGNKALSILQMIDGLFTNWWSP